MLEFLLLMKKSLSIVIPVYNEGDLVQDIIQSISENREKLTYELGEVVVVDDGSVSSKCCRIFFDTLDMNDYNFSLRLIEHEKNLGKGAAIKTGMKVTTGSHIMFVDVDQSTAWESVRSLLKFSFENPEYVVCGSRAVIGSVVKIKQSKWRILLGRWGGKIIHSFFKIPINDTQCGCKVFPKKVADMLTREGYTNRWAVDVEWLSKCVRYNIPLKEFPVSWTDSRDSQVKPWHFIVTALEILRIYIKK